MDDAEIRDLSKSLKNFLVEIYKKGSVTAKTQNTYSIWSFKYALQELAPYDLIETDGVFQSGKEKVWKLTTKGIKFVKLILQINDLLVKESE